MAQLGTELGSLSLDGSSIGEDGSWRPASFLAILTSFLEEEKKKNKERKNKRKKKKSIHEDKVNICKIDKYFDGRDKKNE